MTKETWSKKSWDDSISAKAYNPDWWETLTPKSAPELWEELEVVYDAEKACGKIPNWATEIVVRMMELPMCGHYAFPANITQIIDAIAAEKCPDVVMRCYTADRERKILLSYYIFCLDGWAKQAPLKNVVAELELRDQLGKKWKQIATSIYKVLGEHSDAKQLVVERLNHRLRWWLKTMIWPDDRRNRFLLDVYSGDVRGNEKEWGAYGNSPYGDPYFAEQELDHVQDLEDQIADEIPDGENLIDRIHSTWLCAPKVFRYLEKLIAEIGAIDSLEQPVDSKGLLQCQETYPDFAANKKSFKALLGQLEGWLKGDEKACPELGKISPVKNWLVQLLRQKMLFHAKYEENFAKLVGMSKKAK